MATWEEIYATLQQAADDDLQETLKSGSGAGLLWARAKSALNPFASDESKAWETEGAARGAKALEDTLGEKGAVAAQFGTQALAGALPVGKALGAGAKSIGAALEAKKLAAARMAADYAASAPAWNKVKGAYDKLSAPLKPKLKEVLAKDAATIDKDLPRRFEQLEDFLKNTNIPEAEKKALRKHAPLADAVEVQKRADLEEAKRLQALSRGTKTNAGARVTPVTPFDGSWRK